MSSLVFKVKGLYVFLITVCLFVCKALTLLLFLPLPPRAWPPIHNPWEQKIHKGQIPRQTAACSVMSWNTKVLHFAILCEICFMRYTENVKSFQIPKNVPWLSLAPELHKKLRAETDQKMDVGNGQTQKSVLVLHPPFQLFCNLHLTQPTSSAGCG